MQGIYTQAAFEMKLIASPIQDCGCSEQEIAQIDELWEGPPAAYLEFLRQIGRGVYGRFVGTDVFFDRCLLFKEFKSEMQASGIEIPDDAVLVLSHQGYIAQYILKGHGDDPPVYEVVKGVGKTIKVADRFSQMILNTIYGVAGRPSHSTTFEPWRPPTQDGEPFFGRR